MRFQVPGRGTAIVWVWLLTMAASASANAATIYVANGGNLQDALNAAAPGDVITLDPTATFVGNFVLPNKGAITNYITIRSAAPDASFPPAGVRITPAYASLLPKIRSSNSLSALTTATSANHWKLMFLEFQANKDSYGDIIALGAGDSQQTTLSQVPYALILDRVYIHGDPALGQKRGLALHSSDTTVENSYISDCKAVGQDSQAISGFNGPGNYLIENNYLEGSTENILFGGADPLIPNLVTSNITVRRNYMRKPLAWRDPIIATPAVVTAVVAPGGGALAEGTYYYKVVARTAAGQTNTASSKASPEVSATVPIGVTAGVSVSWTPVVGATEYSVYGRAAGLENMYWRTTEPYFTDTGTAGTAGSPGNGTKWSVKNIFELKNAQDVLVEGNVFENLWVADQPGFPIVFTPRNSGGTAPWVVVQRVTFRHNIVRHTAGGVNVLGRDNVRPTQLTNHIAIVDNVFDDLTSATWGSGSKPFQLGDGPDSMTLDHNTIITTDTTILALYGGSSTSPTPITNAVYTNNMSAHNTYGIFGSGLSSGLASINGYMPGAIVSRNVLAGGNASKYPTGNFFPTVAAWQASFANFAGGDYHLNATSLFKSAATDGTDLGADIDRITAETANALTGDNRLPGGGSSVQIVTTSLPDGMVNQAYAQTLACTGGSGPCAWAAHDVTLPVGLTFDAVAATITGTPTTVQTGAITVDAYDPASPSNTASATLQVTIMPPPFVVTMPAAPAGQVGSPYSITPTVTGTVGSATWSVVSGELPPGVALDAFSGIISGVPTGWGSFNALVQAQDSWAIGRTDAKAVTITVAPLALVIGGSSLPRGIYQQPYQGALSATGGTGVTTWSLVGSALPAGLSMDASGVISGTPTVAGSFVFTVQAVDANWPTNMATASVTLVVDPPPLTVSIPPAPGARVGLPYQLTATAMGQLGTVSWAVVSGALPPGVALSPVSGTISGTPTAFGSFTATVQARDSYDASRVAFAPVTINVAPSAIAIVTTSLPSANIAQAYSAALVAIGGTGITTWTVTSGALPGGLSLASTGSIRGTPTAVGTFAITVQATDAGAAGNVASQALSLIVSGREIVLYSSDASKIAGTWTVAADPSAAGGSRLTNLDRGAAKLATPLAAPANYFEMTFQAEAGVPYHFWLRGTAEKDSWANDSVMLQFSGSVDASGTAKARIGTTTGYDVNLEDCSGCGLAGWGWQDNGWGVNVFGPDIYFAAPGTQTLRVQVKEDGFSIDQIVLSAGKYRTSAPGALKNDTTILPR